MSISPEISSLSTHRYVWVASSAIANLPVGTMVGERYRVVAPQIWDDTQHSSSPAVPDQIPDSAIPYMRLCRLRLHVPEVYGFCSPPDTPSPLMVLTNSPIDTTGTLFSRITQAWSDASAVRQLYWLWQLLQLWDILRQVGVASSLLVDENIRVDGWRVRLLELHRDPVGSSPENAPENLPENLPENAPENLPESTDMNAIEEGTSVPMTPPLWNLTARWHPWIDSAHPDIRDSLHNFCDFARSPDADWSTLSSQLNQLLIEQAARLPLQLNVVGATTTGPQRKHNEDYCYPNHAELSRLSADESELPALHDYLLPHVAIVCDGIGGHAGGEVASQLAVRSLQLQIRAMLTELSEQSDLIEPDIIMQQLATSIRVVNNMIATQNDSQGREARQRMGTTLVMALQLPQSVATPDGVANTHELFIAHVGDSRAYWLTPQRCHLLTVDDDVASREVIMGRSLYCNSQQRPDAEALTQALGTRDGDLIQPTIQRFIIEEDGILLLCSDGLSDNHWVERCWQESTQHVLDENVSLDAALQSWIDIANERNGHDNTSVVMLHCQVSRADSVQPIQSYDDQPAMDAMEEEAPVAPVLPALSSDVTPHDLSEASRALLYNDGGADDVDADDGDAADRQDDDGDHRLPDDSHEYPALIGLTDEADEADGILEDFFAQPDDDEEDYADAVEEGESINTGAIALGLAVLIFAASAAGVFAWKQISPNSFQRAWQRVIEQLDQL
ncbi:MAG TPA: PP2C family protein-serine/threonine phosphatase [Elainellaceae cyanobacterium]